MFKIFEKFGTSVSNMANEVESKGYSVDASYGEESVKVVRRSDQQVVIELEGEDAVEFINYAEDLATASDVDIATALLAQAKSYVDVL